MNILANAKQHFNERRKLKGPIEVKEWGDENGPAKIYYQVPNMQERSEIFKFVQDGGLEGVVMTLILIARDESGAPIFTGAQKDELMRSVDPDIVSRIVNHMDIVEIEDDLGN